VNDPSAFGRLFLTAEEINAEATGYFLIPNTVATTDLIAVLSAEASRVVGSVTFFL
jgi:hypothetical protein